MPGTRWGLSTRVSKNTESTGMNALKKFEVEFTDPLLYVVSDCNMYSNPDFKRDKGTGGGGPQCGRIVTHWPSACKDEWLSFFAKKGEIAK